MDAENATILWLCKDTELAIPSHISCFPEAFNPLVGRDPVPRTEDEHGSATTAGWDHVPHTVGMQSMDVTPVGWDSLPHTVSVPAADSVG